MKDTKLVEEAVEMESLLLLLQLHQGQLDYQERVLD
ncbi:hypothetical protein STHY105142_08120 [Streptococcus hyovaginalis]